MNHQIKILSIVAGLIALTLPISKAAIASTYSNSLGTAGYALDLRIDSSTNWTYSGSSQIRYGNDNFNSDGNLLFGSDASVIGVIDSSTGSAVTQSSGNSNVRGLAQSGTNYLAAGGSSVTGNTYSAAAFPAAATGTADYGRESITVANIGGQDYVFGLTSGRDAITRKVVNADGSVGATSWTTGDMGTRLRAMTYVPGIGLYVTQNSSDGTPMLQLVDNSGNFTTITGFGTSTWNLTEAIAHANIGGNDYLFLAATPAVGADPNGVMVGLLDGSGAVTAWDFYAGYDFFAGNTGALALWADSSQLYWGTGPQVSAFSLSAIPEPSTYAMLALGMAMSAYGLRVSRRKKQVAQKA